MRKSDAIKPKTKQKSRPLPSPGSSADDARSIKSAPDQNREIQTLYAKLSFEETSKLIHARDCAGSNSSPEVEKDSALDGVMKVFRRFEIWQFLPGELSVQQIILNGPPDCTQLYE